MINEEFSGLSPVNFFRLQADLHHFEKKADIEGKKFILPSTSSLCGESSPFATVSLGWSTEGIRAYLIVDQPYHRSFYPEVTRGDSVELFIDTRDVKTSGYNTRFCHHFFFLPEPIEGHHAAEITRFRSEESHLHCDPSLLKSSAKLKKNHFVMDIFIPSECLHGYDPEQFDRLGFSYRINRPDGPSQHFSVLSDEYKIQEQPSLWSSLRLVQ